MESRSLELFPTLIKQFREVITEKERLEMLKLNFFDPDVSKKRLNAAVPSSSVVKTSEIISAVLSPDVAV